MSYDIMSKNKQYDNIRVIRDTLKTIPEANRVGRLRFEFNFDNE